MTNTTKDVMNPQLESMIMIICINLKVQYQKKVNRL